MKFFSANIHYLVCILLVSMYTDKIYSQEQSTLRFIDSLIQHKQKTFEVPGIAIGIVKDGKTFFQKAYGVQSLHTEIPLTNQSVFHMASVSKPITATAIMKLVEEGKLKLSNKLVEYLPNFVMNSPAYKDITLQQILTHTSGIPDVNDYEWEKPQYDDKASLRYVNSFKNQKLDFLPGSSHKYSNAAYNLLAAVIQKVTEIPFETYMKQEFFSKVGMKNSTFLKEEVTKELATSPHVENCSFTVDKANVYPYNRVHAPSSTLHANTDDMLLWAQLYLNKGEWSEKEIFSKETYTKLTDTQIPFKNGKGMCLGWFTAKIGEKQLFRHSGGDEGYSTFLGFIPEVDFAIVIMANSDTIITEYIATVIMSKLYNNKILNYKTPISFALRKLILEKDINAFKKEYFRLEKEDPNSYAFGKGYLDGLGYDLLEKHYYEKAIAIFKFHLEIQPEVPGFYDSVGDGYLAWNKPEEALVWYKRANKKDPDKEMSLEKIKKLSFELQK
ncbi:serine hydrolase [Tenacibaculum amylolyticum]|uniref:serine hydrolase n=1 Tax=Tenacibaculum amylolyticum TaxID=104269 RepID=UPI0038965907